MKPKIHFTALFIFLSMGISTGPNVLWTKVIGLNGCNYGMSVRETSDGGYVITSFEEIGVGAGISILVRTDANGDMLWVKRYSGEGIDRFYELEEIDSGGYILAGETDSSNSDTLGNKNASLIRVNDSGDSLWTRIYGGMWDDLAYSVDVVGENGFIFSGYTVIDSGTASSAWIVRTNAAGDTLWTKTFSSLPASIAYSVINTSDGGFVATGVTSDVTLDSNFAFLIKLDDLGEVNWINEYGVSFDRRANDVKQTSDGGYILTGSTWSHGMPGRNIMLIKTDEFGEVEWTQVYNDSGLAPDDHIGVGYSVLQTDDGGYILTGEANTQSPASNCSHLKVIRTNSIGDSLWTFNYESDCDLTTSNGYDLSETEDGGFVVSGYLNNDGTRDILLIRFGPEIVGVEEEMIYPKAYSLSQNYPNPFNPETTIRFALPAAGYARITIYNLRGEEVVRLIDANLSAGNHQINWDASNLPSGIYFYRLQAGSFVQTKKMVLLK